MARRIPPRHARHARQPGGRPDRRAGARYGVLRRHAIPDPANQPLRCYPGLAENAGRVPAAARGNDGKVCFATEEAARAAAAELLGVARDKQVYRCPRVGGTGPDGHWHLTTERTERASGQLVR